MFAMRAILLLSNRKRARPCYYRKPLLCNTVVFVICLSNKAEVVAILNNKPNAELLIWIQKLYIKGVPEGILRTF